MHRTRRLRLPAFRKSMTSARSIGLSSMPPAHPNVPCSCAGSLLTGRAPKSAPAFINGLFTNFDRAALRLKEAFTSRPHCPPQQEDANMLRSLSRLSMAAVLLAALNGSATATPNCLKDQQAYALTDDVVQWTMTIVPRAE